MPFVRVDTQGDVALYIFDSADVTTDFPWELVVRLPRGTHAEERGMCDCLRVSSDAVVGLGRKIDVLGAKTGKDLFDQVKTLIRGAVLNESEWLAFGVYTWAMERMAGHNLDVRGKMLFKSGDFWSFAGSLASNDCVFLGG